MKSRNVSLLLAGILMSMSAATAYAAGNYDFPCMDEIEAYCKNVQPGGGKIIQCLNGHRSDLAPVCRDKVDQALVKFEEAKKICADDIKKQCGDVTPGEGRIFTCLKAKKDLVSPACQKQIDIWGGDSTPKKSATGSEQKK